MSLKMSLIDCTRPFFSSFFSVNINHHRTELKVIGTPNGLLDNHSHKEERSESMSEVAEIPSTNTDPSHFLSNIIGSSVVVKLHNGVQYGGKLQSIDGFMNVVLQQGKEVSGASTIKSYGDVFIRGNNVLYISEE